MTFGELMDTESAFGDLRRRWRKLVAREEASHVREAGRPLAIGELTEELKYGREAVELRIEVATRVRNEILKLRLSLGYPEDDPALGLAETWAREPKQQEFKSKVDGSLVKKE